MRDSHLAECVCPMASIVENESVFGIDRVHKIRAKTDGKPNHAYEVWRGGYYVGGVQRPGT